MSFQEKYLSILEIVQPEIEQIKEKMFDGIEVQEPLKSKLFDVLNAPSKHIRSVVSILYLKALGIEIDEKQIHIKGKTELVGTTVEATDLRAGACLVLAGLLASGTTKVANIEHVLRGYENIVQKLTDVGADIKLKEEN